MRDNSRKIGARRRRAMCMLVACLAIRALIPIGYMPGNALAGEFFVLCPNGLPASVAEALHSGHGGHAQGVVDADRDCPIGTALNFAALPTDFVEQTDSAMRLDTRVPFVESRYASVQERFYESRAPPIR